ncbi:MAG: hypothetical protein PHF25_05855 [Candidatus Margulisbacteria bacterium]|nr:hypothetical protein [Candidatus Margulisiibacteriota bacterium]
MVTENIIIEHTSSFLNNNTLLGVVAGSLLSFLGLNWVEIIKTRNKKNILKNSLLSEVYSIKLFLIETFGEYIDKKYNFFPKMIITQNYFSIYESSCSGLGLLNKSDVMKDIILFYNQVKQFIEMLHVNNCLVESHVIQCGIPIGKQKVYEYKEELVKRYNNLLEQSEIIIYKLS